MEPTPDYLLITLKLLGALALLIYGMKTMSEALQKMTGPQLRHILGAMTTNRMTGMITGLLLTVAVQSSSATTVMTVSFVDAGLLSLAQAISVVMGANIGTTLTAWIISAGTTFKISSLVWPLFLIGIILIHKKSKRYVGDLLYGMAFMLTALAVLSEAGNELNLDENHTLINFFASFDSESYWTILSFLLIGTVLTCIVQSSAAVMAITMVLCTSGVLSIYQGIALILGENIGTTLTANLAALTANTQARRAAMAHFLFNVFGVVWVMVFFYPFVHLACSIVGVNPATATQTPLRLSFALSAFHTAFNITNTLLLIGLVSQIEHVVCWLIKPKEDKKEVSHLHYIQGGLMKTPEISVLQAQKETALFAIRMQRMFGMVGELMDTTEREQFEKIFERIKKYEGIADNMEIEIGHYLERVSDAHLSDETKSKIRAMLREISELESIGDSCFNLARTLQRKNESNEDFTPELYDNIRQMMELVNEALTQMCAILSERKAYHSLQPTISTENKINLLRNSLRTQNSLHINERQYSYSLGTIYIDIICECERLGDYVLNVAEARFGKNSSAKSTNTAHQSLLTYTTLQLNLDSKTATIENKPVTLTHTEFELLRLFAENPGKIFSRKELISNAWPADVIVSDRTIDVNIARLRKKIGALSPSLITRSGFGYGFKEEVPSIERKKDSQRFL